MHPYRFPNSDGDHQWLAPQSLEDFSGRPISKDEAEGVLPLS